MQDTTHTDLSGRSLPQLLRELSHSLGDLVRSEIALARAEMSEKASQAGTALASLAAGAAFGLAALIIVLQALVLVLAEVMPPWLASSLVGVAVAVLAFIMIRKGQNDLKAVNLAPRRTVDNVRQDARMMSDHVSNDTTHRGPTAAPADVGRPASGPTLRHDANREIPR